MINRRIALQFAAAGVGAAVLAACVGPRGRRRRRVRRRVRRRIRRRIRRRVAWRVVGPRRVLVVPVAIAVGWELTVDTRVVVVHELRPDVVIVIDGDGAKQELPIEREDTADNAEEQQGTQLPDTDRSTPARESDEDVEEEVEE